MTDIYFIYVLFDRDRRRQTEQPMQVWDGIFGRKKESSSNMKRLTTKCVDYLV